MVRLALETCVPNLLSPTDIYAGENKNRLLVRKGSPLTSRVKGLLAQNNIQFLDFPLPYEKAAPPPYTFSSETETALFRFVQNTYRAFKENSIENPLDLRKEAYEILTQAFQEFRKLARAEKPLDDKPPRRQPGSVLHLRTVGALEDSLFEHAKNVSLLCLVMGFDYFYDNKQWLAEIHKVAVAGLFADIGMMKVPSRIFQKNGDLTDKEKEIIQNHPETSAQFVETLFRQKSFVTIETVRHHHERCDGSGYPAKLRVHQLEPYTLLLGVADSYASMVSKRYFRSAQNPVDTLWELNDQAGKQYDEKSVKCLNFRVAPYPAGSVAKFAGQKLVQVVDLDNIPLDFEKVRVFKKELKENPYNIPKSIRSFAPGKPIHKLKNVSIQGHLDKMGIPVDTYDLLVLYDYARIDA